VRQKKKAISTVLTTMIILSSSIILSLGVVVFGTGLFQSGTRTEAITIYSIELWVHESAPDGLAWGALSLRNTGDVETSITKIGIRGTDIPYSNWYVDNTISEISLQRQLKFTGWSGTNGMLQIDDPDLLCNNELEIDLDGSGNEEPICADSSSGPPSLAPGTSAIIYFKLINGTLSQLDSGQSAGIIVSANKANVITSIIAKTP